MFPLIFTVKLYTQLHIAEGLDLCLGAWEDSRAISELLFSRGVVLFITHIYPPGCFEKASSLSGMEQL